MPIEVRLSDVVKQFGDVRRGRPHRPRGRGFRVLQPPRSLRLRQDDHAADDRRLRTADVRTDRAPRRGRDVAATVPAERQHGLPELRALPAPDDLRERRVRPAPQGRQGQRGEEPGPGDARPRRAPGLRVAQADPDLGRPGAARRARPGADQPAGGPAPGRTARSARSQAAQADAGRAQADPAGGRDHLHLRDPRPGRGDDDVRSDRRHEPRPLRAARRPGEPVRAPEDPLRRRVPRRQQPAPRHRAGQGRPLRHGEAPPTTRSCGPRAAWSTARPKSASACDPRRSACGSPALPSRLRRATTACAGRPRRLVPGREHPVQGRGRASGARLTVYEQNVERATVRRSLDARR